MKNNDADDQILIRPAAVARMLDCSRPYTYKRAKFKKIPVVQWECGGSKVLRFRREDV